MLYLISNINNVTVDFIIYPGRICKEVDKTIQRLWFIISEASANTNKVQIAVQLVVETNSQHKQHCVNKGLTQTVVFRVKWPSKRDSLGTTKTVTKTEQHQFIFILKGIVKSMTQSCRRRQTDTHTQTDGQMNAYLVPLLPLRWLCKRE